MAMLQRGIAGVILVSAFAAASAQIVGPLPVAWRWVDRIERKPSGSPLVVGDRIFIAAGARMYCLDRSTGNELWRFPNAEPIAAQFVTNSVVIGTTMIAAADDKSIYGINLETGELKFTVFAPANVFAKPAVAGDVAVFPLADNSLYAIDANTGEAKWPTPYKNGSTIYPTLIGWNQLVLFMSSNNQLTALDARTAKPAWRPKDFGNLSPLSGLSLYGDTVYVTSGSYLTAMLATNGRVKWESVVPGVLRFQANGGPDGVVCVTEDGKLHSFNSVGRPSSRNGFDIGSQPVAAPRFAGKFVTVPTANGSIKLLDPFSGEVKWNYTVPPIVTGLRILDKPVNFTSDNDDPAKDADLIKYVIAAGSVVVAEDSIYVLMQDGSIVGFDKKFGVDMTPPEAMMIWPNSGDQVSGRPPMELVITVNDDGSGVNFDSIQVTINGKPYIHEIDKEDRIRIKMFAGAKENPPLPDGRATIIVNMRDWMGNEKNAQFVLSIDNLLPPLGFPKLAEEKPVGKGKGGVAGGIGG